MTSNEMYRACDAFEETLHQLRREGLISQAGWEAGRDAVYSCARAAGGLEEEQDEGRVG